MRGVLVCLGVSAVVGLAVLATDSQAGDKGGKVALDKVPKKVMDAVKARFPGAEITSVGKETVDGSVVYDIRAAPLPRLILTPGRTTALQPIRPPRRQRRPRR